MYVFTRTFPGGVETWTEEPTNKLTATPLPARTNVQFGQSVAIDGDGAVVGDNGGGPSTAYLFARSESSPFLVETLRDS